MDNFDYQNSMLLLIGQCRVVAALDLDELHRAQVHAQDFGCFTDPTLWREKIKALTEDRELVEAALPLWRYAKKLEAAAKARAEAGGG